MLMNQPKTQNEEEILDFNNPDFQFVPKGVHEWRQQGPYLNCFSCDLQHGVYIGVNKQMIGINAKGDPILKKL